MKKKHQTNKVQPANTNFDEDFSTALRGLKTFNVLKTIVLGCALKYGARKEANLIDIDILKTLLKELQVHLDHVSHTSGLDVT